MKIFETDDINLGRQQFLDVAKVVAIFGMILIHVFMYSGMEHIQLWSLIPITLFGGVFAAPVFMFSMGVGMAYSKNTSPKYSMQRGINLTIKAWILNILRLPLPAFIFWYFTKDTVFLKNIIFDLCGLDILHFAGLAFIVFAIFKKFNFSAKRILIISVLLALMGSFVRNFGTHNLVLDIILGHFMGVSKNTNFETAFPLVHWLIFVAGGYYFGELLKRCNSLDKFFKSAFFMTFPIFTTYFIFGLINGWGMFNIDTDAYYHMHFIDMLYSFAAIFTIISICYFITKVLNSKMLTICESISKNINEIYIQQWIYIGWFVQILAINVLHIKLSLPIVLFVAITIFIISSILAELYRKYQKYRQT
ncbi:MAG: hypothetical protein MJ237_01990 [bacterium]|nr:hypothetical protein [bacterium]